MQSLEGWVPRDGTLAAPEDHHRRTANDVEADRLIAARNALVLRLKPFVYLEDQNRDPADFFETVSKRISEEAQKWRDRAEDAAVDRFVEAAISPLPAFSRYV